MTELSDLRATMRTKETLSNLGEMAAGIAHEFKNSLATIGGYARLLEKSAPDPKPAQSLRAEVAHLTQVVTDFLAFARPQTIALSPCDLGEIIGECVQSLSEAARQNNVDILLSRELPIVAGDPVLLRTAFGNLILNAVESISEPRLNRTVTISSNIDIEPGMAQVSISDTGDGIPEEIRPNVFIPFFSTKSRGYGMGLAIVQKVVVSHNGRIDVYSQIGQGTTFSCALPLWGTLKQPAQ
jgi:signal transduction histidine kinase